MNVKISSPPTTLAAFLRARLDEDEIAARRAGNLRMYRTEFPGHMYLYNADSEERIDLASVPPSFAEATWLEHAARHMPGRELARVDSYRRIIAQVGDDDGSEILRALALAYGDHPDCRPEWLP